jgi:dCTP deaminase
MSLLSYKQIIECLVQGYIQNALEENIGAASLDVRLGPKILVEQPPVEEKYRYKEISLHHAYKMNWLQKAIPEEGYVLYPGQFILAQTIETFHLPPFISCEFRLRSSLARMGVDHSLAAWIDAGFSNSVLTLELKNITQYHSIRLFVGDRIGQIIFYQHEPVPIEQSYKMKGRYNNCLEVRAATG